MRPLLDPSVGKSTPVSQSLARIFAITFLFAFIVAVPRVGHAQIGTLWSLDRLATKADCVVIAEHLQTRDTGRRTMHPELKPAFPVVELESTFTVLAVLKPCVTQTSVAQDIKIRHYAPTPAEAARLINGGTTLNFTVGARYLMFLKLADGSRYEPLTGHSFPTDSVYRLEGVTNPRF
jgi:hypothetical protein